MSLPLGLYAVTTLSGQQGLSNEGGNLRPEEPLQIVDFDSLDFVTVRQVIIIILSLYLALDNSGAMQWTVEKGSEKGLVRIRNEATKLFISYNGDAFPMNPVVVLPQPRDWVLTPGQASGTF